MECILVVFQSLLVMLLVHYWFFQIRFSLELAIFFKNASSHLIYARDIYVLQKRHSIQKFDLKIFGLTGNFVMKWHWEKKKLIFCIFNPLMHLPALGAIVCSSLLVLLGSDAILRCHTAGKWVAHMQTWPFSALNWNR